MRQSTITLFRSGLTATTFARRTVFTVLLACASTASAAITMDMDSFGPSITELTSPGSPNPFGNNVNAQALVLDQFDGSLGTLTGVTLTFDVGYDATGSITNASSSNINAIVTQPADFIIDSTSGLFAQTTVTAVDTTGLTTFASGAGTSIAFSATSTQILTSSGGALTLSDFVGVAGGTFPIDYTTTVSTNIQGGGGNLDPFIETTGQIKATVEYDFEPVPEPASAALMMIAGFGLLGMRSRR